MLSPAGPRSRNYNNYYFADYAQWHGANFPVVAFLPGLADPLVRLNDSEAYQPWNSVSRGYTNPFWQHYVRLNRTDSGLAKGTPADTVRTSSKNPLAFMQGGAGCTSGVSCPPSPHVHWVPPPVYLGGRYAP